VNAAWRQRLRSWPRFSVLPVALAVGTRAEAARMPLVAALVVGIGLAWLAGLTTSRVKSQWRLPNDRPWTVGDEVPLTTTVTNVGRRTSAPMTLRRGGHGIARTVVVVPALAPGQSATLVETLRLLRRSPAAPLVQERWVHNRLIGASLPAGNPSNIVALPCIRARPEPPPTHVLSRFSRADEYGRGTGRRGSADPLLVRPFAAGDPVSSVHWRSTARAGTPVVMEREQLAGGTLVLLVCGVYVAGDEASPADGVVVVESWEQAVARAAGIVQAAGSLSVPIMVVTAAPATALSGVGQPDAVLDWLAALGPAGPAQPDLVERAVRAAQGGLVAVLTQDPWLAAEVQAVAPTGSVVDLGEPW
jgi:uncharacterized protein (DUF58 family)